VKTKILVLVLAVACFGMPCAASAVHLTGNFSADFLGSASASQSVAALAIGSQPLFWGVGWEVIIGKVGFGGDYMVSFFRDSTPQWWLDWYAPALYISYHPIGANSSLDPFFEAGVGSAGQVMLARRPPVGSTNLSLALFPFVAAGLSLDLDGLLLGAKLAYTPAISPIPATEIPRYPLGSLQVTVTAGISLGWPDQWGARSASARHLRP
jgi:hypothetical protein